MSTYFRMSIHIQSIHCLLLDYVLGIFLWTSYIRVYGSPQVEDVISGDPSNCGEGIRLKQLRCFPFPHCVVARRGMGSCLMCRRRLWSWMPTSHERRHIRTMRPRQPKVIQEGAWHIMLSLIHQSLRFSEDVYIIYCMWKDISDRRQSRNNPSFEG